MLVRLFRQSSENRHVAAQNVSEFGSNVVNYFKHPHWQTMEIFIVWVRDGKVLKIDM